VQQRGPPEPVTVGGRQVELLGEHVGERANPFGVPARLAVMRRERGDERQDGLSRASRIAVEAVLTSFLYALLQDADVAGLPRELEPRRHVVGEGEREVQQGDEGEQTPRDPLDQRDGEGRGPEDGQQPQDDRETVRPRDRSRERDTHRDAGDRGYEQDREPDEPGKEGPARPSRVALLPLVLPRSPHRPTTYRSNSRRT
jgi:hypothetical protein